MGKWKKAVAALAAVPMLMALAPAANAVESDPTDSSAAQRALAAALKSNAKAAADSDLLASLDFDNVAAGATGTIVDDTTGTKATILRCALGRLHQELFQQEKVLLFCEHNRLLLFQRRKLEVQGLLLFGQIIQTGAQLRISGAVFNGVQNVFTCKPEYSEKNPDCPE